MNLENLSEDQKKIVSQLRSEIDKLWINNFAGQDRVAATPTEVLCLIYALKQDELNKPCLRFLSQEEVLRFIIKNDKVRDGFITKEQFSRSVIE
jgi:hypothetical protein